ncbi:hypothetical protein LCGC14_1878390, partial [marine sediment metagenome]
ITPKSCGGGEEFKLLALLGDRVLNLELFEILSTEGIKDSSTMTIRISNHFHNKDILCEVGKILTINKFMNPIDFNYKINKMDLKESVEALIGANFKAHGYGTHKEVIKKIYMMMKDIEKNMQKDRRLQLLSENPIGTLLELSNNDEFSSLEYDVNQIGGSDDSPLYICTILGNLFEKGYEIESDSFHQNEQDAKKDAAVEFLMMVEGNSEIREKSKSKEIIIQPKPKTLLELKEITFSLQGEVSKPKEIRLSSDTGETLVEWAKRKSIKNPFSMLVLLANRVEGVTGSSWHASLPNGNLILSKTTLDDKDYFEVGFAESISRAKKIAARKLIKNSEIFEWLKINYANKLI